MHEYDLLEILAVGFVAALILGYLANRIGLSPIVGYLVAGFLVGPNTPGFIADQGLAHQLSEAGVILLMFGVGLHFNLKDLLAVKGVAIPGAIVQSTVATILGAGAAHLFGIGFGAGLVLGLGLSVASTVVLLRVLEDNGKLNSVDGHVAVGWLIVEDIFTVVVLILLPSLAPVLLGKVSADALTLGKAFGLAMLRLAALWVVVLVVGGKVMPWILTKVVRTRSQELFTLTVLVTAFATAVFAAKFFDASMALGAFLGGMVVGKTKVSHQAGADVLPLRDAFAVLFFLSVGMLFSPSFLLEQPALILICLAIVLFAKPLTALLVVTMLGYSTHTALVVATALAQVGEFSFILASAAYALGLIPSDVNSILIVCAIVSITLNPTYFKTIPFWERVLHKYPRIYKLFNFRADHRALRENEKKRKALQGENSVKSVQGKTAIVVGYGPTGRSVAEALESKGMTPVIIDLNVDTVNDLTAQGKAAVFGDSSRREILEAAGINRADYIVITIPVLENTVETAALAANLNPEIRILVRARFIGDEGILKQIGVASIAFEEEEVAKGLAESVLKDLERCRVKRPSVDFEDVDPETEPGNI